MKYDIMRDRATEPFIKQKNYILYELSKVY